MTFDSFLRTVPTKTSTSNPGSFVEAESHHADASGLYFTIKSWDDGRHIFGPAPWSGETPAVGERLLVVFIGSGIDQPRVVSQRTPTTLALISSNEVSLSAGSDGILSTGPLAGQHLAIDGDEIQSKSNATTAGQLNLNPHGGEITTGAGILTAGGQVRISSTAAPALTSGAGAVNIGSLSGVHIAIGANDIQAKATATTTSSLDIQPLGGNTNFGTGVVNIANLTASRALTTDASKNLVSSAVTATELGYVSGVTSSIQTQINSANTNANNRVAKAGDTMTSWLNFNGQYGVAWPQGQRMWGRSDGWVIMDGTPAATGWYTPREFRVGDAYSFDGTGWKMRPSGDTDTGIYYWSDGYIGFAGNGAGVLQTRSNSGIGIGPGITDDSGGISPALWVRKPQKQEAWSLSHIVLRSNSGGTGSACQIAMHADNVAPIIMAVGPDEQIHIRNNPNSGYAPIAASAFNVNSTERVKTDIEDQDDDRVLSIAKRTQSIKFRHKIGPQTLRKSDKFKDIDARWQAKGHSALVAPIREVTPETHDCSVDECGGTAENPCSVTINNTERFGFSAEALYELIPEAVDVDDEGKPYLVDMAQIASLALAGVGALARRIEALEG